MADIQALVAAFFFALAATLQQKGALGEGEVSLAHPRSLLNLGRQPMWLCGSAALLVGYVFQAVALDHGRLSVVQPLLVTTIVFALPLGRWLTAQHVGRREILGAAVVVLGLGLFIALGDPAGGNDNAPGREWAIACVVAAAVTVTLLALGGRGGAARKAGMYGAAAGILYGLSASLWKPTASIRNSGDLGSMLTSWEFWAFAAAGVLAFLIQQVSLGTGRLAPSVATTAVANPIVGVIVGIVLLNETLSEPNWHKVLAWAGLGVAMWGAIVTSMAREADSQAAGKPAGAAAAT